MCVGTPSGIEGEADMSQVGPAALRASVDNYAPPRTIVVNKSTMPMGSVDLVMLPSLQNATRRRGFTVVTNPEFLREGSASTTFNPDRIVLGSDRHGGRRISARGSTATQRADLITDQRAEMIKYASNAFLATKIYS